jgi:hypothetical protein
MKESFLHTVNQLPDISKTLLSRLGGILRLTLISPDWNDPFWDKKEEKQNEIRLNLVSELLEKLPLKEELKEMHLNFAKLLFNLINDNCQENKFQDLIKLISEKETSL